MVQSIQWVQLQTPGSSDYQGGSHVCEQFRWIIRWGTWIFNMDMNGSNTGPDYQSIPDKKGVHTWNCWAQIHQVSRRWVIGGPLASLIDYITCAAFTLNVKCAMTNNNNNNK